MDGFFKIKWFGLLFPGWFLIFPQDAISRCRPMVPQATLLEAIPPEAEGSPVIARVSILSVAHDPREEGFPDARFYALAIVIDAEKGVIKDDLILLHASRDICDITIYPDINSFREGYIAGKFDQNNIFWGFWDMRFGIKQK